MTSTDLQENHETELQTPQSGQPGPMGSGLIEDSESVVFEPLEQNTYDLFYACLLIPRFNTHYLMGDLAERLPEWLQQICISYGWRLEQVTVKADHLQWILRVPPATSTAYFVRSIRMQTSTRIFDEFPRFKNENISKDFWSPGYLIAAGAQPHSSESIQTFIRQTRQQQGILRNG
jgi:REP element-mobilizing transposase RayT